MQLSKTLRIAAWTGPLIWTLSAPAQPSNMGTEFVFQGFLQDTTGTPISVNAYCKMQFTLWDDPNSTNPINMVGSAQLAACVPVSKGIFVTPIGDFGVGAIDGTGRWLEIAMVCDPNPANCPGLILNPPLAPRIAMRPEPHALALPGLWTQQNDIAGVPTTPNLIGGYWDNNLTAPVGVIGATISGGGLAGALNLVTDDYGTVAGGSNNQAGDNDLIITNAVHATVSGGESNIASGAHSTVPGGESNTAGGDWSFAAGKEAQANDDGTFVWADSTGGNFSSTGDNQFLIRAAGGVGIGTPTPAADLDVNGMTQTQQFKMVPTSGLGKVLTSDQNGVGTWATPTSASDTDDWNLLGNSVGPNDILGTLNSFPLRIYAGNFERMRIVDSTGNVGIGTTSPTTRTEISYSDLTTGASILRLTNLGQGGINDFTETGIAFNNSVGNNPNYHTARIYSKYDGTWVADGRLSLQVWGAGGFTDAVNIVSGGKVGIGTTSPSENLDVNGTAAIRTLPTPSTPVDVVVADAGGKLYRGAQAGSGDPADDWIVSGTNMYPIPGVINVGIGTASPGTKLAVEDPVLPAIGISPGVGGLGGLELAVATGNWFYSNVATTGDAVIRIPGCSAGCPGEDLILSNRANGAHRFTTGDTVTEIERMTILNNGAVGIGVTTPSAKLEVLSAAGQHTISATSPSGGNAVLAQCNLGGNAVVGIANTDHGGVFSATSGIGVKGIQTSTLLSTTSIGVYGLATDPGGGVNQNGGIGVKGEEPVSSRSNLDKAWAGFFAGDIEATGYLAALLPPGFGCSVVWDSGTHQFFCDSSSRRYKENITTLEDDFERLLDARPVVYTRPGRPDQQEIGWIAEEIHDLGLTHLTEYDAEKRVEGVNYRKAVVYLTEIAKVQAKKIESLESRLTDIEAVVAQLLAERKSSER